METTEKRNTPATIGVDLGTDDHTVVAKVDAGKIVERRATWPDPAKMNFDPNTPDKYNAALRVDGGKPKRRRND